jgi:hypothetical protein
MEENYDSEYNDYKYDVHILKKLLKMYLTVIAISTAGI